MLLALKEKPQKNYSIAKLQYARIMNWRKNLRYLKQLVNEPYPSQSESR